MKKINKKWKWQRGFTVVELLVVLFILGIIITWGVPKFRSFFARVEVNNGVRTVTLGLNSARYMAINMNRSVKCCVEGNRVVLKKKVAGAWEEFRGFDVAEKVILSANSSPVFSPLGSVSPLASFYVQNERMHFKITISMAGRVKITELP